MMPDKSDEIIKSVKRLLDLNVSESEIILNLKEAGVDESKAKELILRAKQAPGEPPKKEEKKEVPEKEEEPEKKEEKTEPAEKEKLVIAEKPAEKTGEKPPYEFDPKELGFTSVKPGKKDFSKMWEKGILTTVTQSLTEMKQIRDELDSRIERNVQAKIDLERKKLQALLDAKTTLMSEKLISSLSEKEQQFDSVIDGKISELREMSKTIHEEIDSMEKSMAQNKKFAAEIAELETSLNNARNRFIQDMNAEMIKSKSKSEEFFSDSEQRMSEIEARLNKTLELETQIIDGLVKDAEDRIEHMVIEKNEDLENQLKGRLAELDKLAKLIEPQRVDSKLKELDEYEKRAKEEIQATLEKTLLKEKAEMEQIKKEVSPQKIYGELEKKYKDFKESSETTLLEIENRLNKAAEIQKNLIANMIKDAEERISHIAVEENEALENELKARIQKMDKLAEGMKVDAVEKKLTALSTYEDEIKNKLAEALVSTAEKEKLALDELKKQVSPEKINQKVEVQLGEWDKRINSRLDSLEKQIKEEIDFEEIRNQKEVLDIFKEQFINTIDKNIGEFNKKINELNSQAKTLEQQVNVRIEKIDRKISELDAFEKNFAKEIGTTLERLTEKSETSAPEKKQGAGGTKTGSPQKGGTHGF